ncbi:unknown [Brachyspira sp. CAG:484]|nr:unknown [Brachyspira sp. CAG:484]
MSEKSFFVTLKCSIDCLSFTFGICFTVRYYCSHKGATLRQFFTTARSFGCGCRGNERLFENTFIAFLTYFPLLFYYKLFYVFFQIIIKSFNVNLISAAIMKLRRIKNSFCRIFSAHHRSFIINRTFSVWGY